jgi:hypothetical protein
MKKLKLDLDTLSVQSFATTAADAAPQGTVHGAEATRTSCGGGPPFCTCPPPP